MFCHVHHPVHVCDADRRPAIADTIVEYSSNCASWHMSRSCAQTHALTGLAHAMQVAEGVATAGVVVALAAKLRVSLPVLTAVAQVLDGALTPTQVIGSSASYSQSPARLTPIYQAQMHQQCHLLSSRDEHATWMSSTCSPCRLTGPCAPCAGGGRHHESAPD